MASEENIQVAVKVRPCSDHIGRSSSCLQCDPASGTIDITTHGREKKFDFNAIFGEDATQDFLYAKVAEPVVAGFLEGINGTIFAYGQTGSGKTYTMIGEERDGKINHQNRGIIPRVFESIFAHLHAQSIKNPEKFKYSVNCSFAELYNEHLYDLLGDAESQLQVRSNIADGVVLQGAAEEELNNVDHGMQTLMQGWNRRKVASTAMNRESSRSHALFMLTLETQMVEDAFVNRRTSRLNLVDLAGSERQAHTKNNDNDRLKEAGNINKSLSILARVIRSLVNQKSNKEYISYRDSLLTFILKDSLGGNSRTAVVVNVHPNSEFVGETLSTLNFAENVKKVKNKAKVNENITCQNVELLKAELLRVKEELKNAQGLPRDDPKKDLMIEKYRNDLEKAIFDSEEYRKMYISIRKDLDTSRQQCSMLKNSVRFLNELKGGKPDFADKLMGMIESTAEGFLKEAKTKVISDGSSSNLEVEKIMDELESLKEEHRKVLEQKEELDKENRDLNSRLTDLMCRTQKRFNKERSISPPGFGDDSSLTPSMTAKERRRRRQTQFTPGRGSVQPRVLFPEVLSSPVSGEDEGMKKKMLELEERADEEEKSRLEIEMQLNQLHQVLREKEGLIAKLESTENERITELFSEVSKLRDERSVLEDRAKSFESNCKELESQVEKFRSRILDSDKLIARQEASINEYMEKILNLEKEVSESSENILSLQESKEQLESQLADTVYEYEQKLSKITTNASGDSGNGEKNSALASRVEELLEELKKKEEDVILLRSEYEKKNAEVKQMRKLRESIGGPGQKKLQAELRDLNREKKNLVIRLEAAERSCDELEDEFNKKLQSVQEKLSEVTSSKEAVESELNRVSMELKTLAQTVLGSTVAAFDMRASVFDANYLNPKSNIFREATDRLREQRDRLHFLEFENSRFRSQSKHDIQKLEFKPIKSTGEKFTAKVDEMSRDLKLQGSQNSDAENELGTLKERIKELEKQMKNQESEFKKKISEADIAMKEVETQKNKALSDLTNMTGHQNHHQKIQYLEKMKTELQGVQKENATLKAKLKRLEGTKEKENTRLLKR
ncbi:hypothetical protein FO519_004695 [Halicephalobus sp. NKZ332]|nr:hypothetical protein FO519_004695 [Halicephalobus sp. NKZ332]